MNTFIVFVDYWRYSPRSWCRGRVVTKRYEIKAKSLTEACETAVLAGGKVSMAWPVWPNISFRR